MERTLNLNRRRGKSIFTTSPTRTSRPARLSASFTWTRPASQVSLASVRRIMTRLHLRNKSRRIGAFSLIGLDGSGVDVAFFQLDEAVGAQFIQIVAHAGRCLLLEQLVVDVVLRAFERQNSAGM